MKHPAEQLKHRLDGVRAILSTGGFLSISEEKRRSLRVEVEGLYAKLNDIDGQFLTAGLLGGTGVGKSTLMNALAGTAIASVSHRRPHTDRVLIYRHCETPALPPLSLGDVPWQEILHQGDAVRQVLLCDLPDFDSLAGAHREQVLNFLEHLDMLIWVSSPEKYADASFYEFLDMAPKAHRNFTFVLNKVDILFAGSPPETAYEQLKSVADGFRSHIAGSGIPRPLIYPLSADEALAGGAPPSPWNQFEAFRQQLFLQRNVKQVTAIKAANLDVEVRTLASGLQREVENLSAYIDAVEQTVGSLEQGRDQWVESGRQVMDLWLDRHMSPEVLAGHGRAEALIGPGYGLGTLANVFQAGKGQGDGGAIDLSQYAPPDEIAIALKRRLEWVDDQARSRALRAALPEAYSERLKHALDIDARFKDLGDRFFKVTASHAGGVNGGYRPVFRFFQWAAYLLLFLLLLFALADKGAWQQAMSAPGVGSVSTLLLSLVHTLFSGKGLAALGTYAVLNLFLAFRFYGWYKRHLRRRGLKIIAALKRDLMKAWANELDRMIDLLNEEADNARDRRAALQEIQ
ncbi:MAG: 50S ribosome-binding GTPase [Deltaproteobacteria bacterium]|nr:50S ribosome-binding GTPase [Deltaproteobacteria bacterium]